MSSASRIAARFHGRPVLTPDELLNIFALPRDVTRDVLLSALEIFREEYDIPVGRLRPADAMAWFLDPPRTKNPIALFFAQAAHEDRLSELSFHLGKARHRAGQGRLPAWPATIRDYVVAYAGKDPPAMLGQ